MKPRTSQTHPLRIDEVACIPYAPGVIGITFCPGKWGDSVYGVPWQRELGLDLDAIKTWGPTLALTLVEEHELEQLRVQGLGEGFQSRGIEWHHLPIADLGAPDDAFHILWASSGAAALDALRAGRRVLVHCRGGLGRAGTVASTMLMELGVGAQEALARVRRARPGAVETLAQERYIVGYRPRLQRSPQ